MSKSENRCNHRACNKQTPYSPPLSSEDISKLFKCGCCKTTKYCSKACQKEDWLYHKHKCCPPDALLFAQHVVDGYTIEDIQNSIDQASPGDIIILNNDESYGVTSPEGGPDSTLVINKPLKLWGKKFSELNCNLEIKSSGQDESNDSIVVVDIIINGQINITSNNYKSITLCEVNVNCPANANGDAVEIGECKGKCLILNCEVLGGSDGVFIATDGAHLKLTEINNAQSRGIFSRRDFLLEDCTIAGCGAYGIKGSAGWREKGKNNDIQSGPWSSFGGASASYQSYGGW